MITKKHWILSLLLVCSPLVLSMRASNMERRIELELLLREFRQYRRCTLRGLSEIIPIAGLVKSENEKFLSLTEGDLQTQVELALRTAGIKVATGSSPVLAVQVQVTRPREEIPLFISSLWNGWISP